MNRSIAAFCLSIVVLTLSACGADRMSERGFSLPEGNALAGKEALVYMHCHECHSISGEELPTLARTDPPFVELGGTVHGLKRMANL